MRRGVIPLFTVRFETLLLFSPLCPLCPECVYCVLFLLGLDLDPDLDTARAEDLDKDEDDCSPGRIGIQVRLTAAAGRSCEAGSHDPRRTLGLPTLDAIPSSHPCTLSIAALLCTHIYPI